MAPRKLTIAKEALRQLEGIHEMAEENRKLLGKSRRQPDPAVGGTVREQLPARRARRWLDAARVVPRQSALLQVHRLERRLREEGLDPPDPPPAATLGDLPHLVEGRLLQRPGRRLDFGGIARHNVIEHHSN